MKKVTLKDIAQELNVTIGTVSHVLNGRDDISWTEMESILKSLGFTVYPDGTVKW